MADALRSNERGSLGHPALHVFLFFSYRVKRRQVADRAVQ
jgi:hypothetical protein